MLPVAAPPLDGAVFISVAEPVKQSAGHRDAKK